MRKKILICFLLLSTSIIFAQDTLCTSNKPIVYIIRNNFTNGINALSKHDFYNNDKFIGALKGFKYLKYECNEGKQLFWTTAENQEFLELDLKSGETYIIKANYSVGIFSSRVKLHFVLKGSDDYNFLKQKIIAKEPVNLTDDKIQKKNIQQKDFILNSLEKYNSKKKGN